MMEMFLLQSEEESRNRAHEAHEASKDRHAMMTMLTNIEGGYFKIKSDGQRKNKDHRRRRKRSYYNLRARDDCHMYMIIE